MRIGNCTQAFKWYHFNDLERHLIQLSRLRHYLTLNIPETCMRCRHIWNTNRDLGPTDGCHFEWTWVTFSDLAKYSMPPSIARFLCDSWASRPLCIGLNSLRVETAPRVSNRAARQPRNALNKKLQINASQVPSCF